MYSCIILLYFFFFKQKTAYEVRISDWSSDVCSSDLQKRGQVFHRAAALLRFVADIDLDETVRTPAGLFHRDGERRHQRRPVDRMDGVEQPDCVYRLVGLKLRSEEHTSELQSLMRISYAVFCLKTQNKNHERQQY